MRRRLDDAVATPDLDREAASASDDLAFLASPMASAGARADVDVDGRAGGDGAAGGHAAGVHGAGAMLGAPGLPREPEAAAVPVDLDVHGRHADAIRRHVEGVLGWQPVDTETAALVPPAVRLADVGTTRGLGTGVPTVLLLDDEARPATVAAAVRRLDPEVVLTWPGGREALSSEVAGLLTRPGRGRAAVRTVRVGGASGGVGTTTVALALAGLTAWRGTATLAIVRPPVPITEVRPVTAAAVSAGDLWRQATTMRGTGPGRAIAVVGAPGRMPEVTDTSIDLVVVDGGVDTDVDLLVCRPDAAGRDALRHTTAGAAVVVGEGPLAARTMTELAHGRPTVHLPWSARVARAGLLGRVPGSLPGAWVRRLVPVAPAGETDREAAGLAAGTRRDVLHSAAEGSGGPRRRRR